MNRFCEEGEGHRCTLPTVKMATLMLHWGEKVVHAYLTQDSPGILVLGVY